MRVATEARQWLGTPFVWQASAKGQGCDCKGLLWGVARAVGLAEADSVPALFTTYRPDRPVPVEQLRAGLAELFDEVPIGDEQVAPGDILLLRWKGRAQHLAIMIDDQVAVHAQQVPGARVVEAGLGALTRRASIDSVWRWREPNEVVGMLIDFARQAPEGAAPASQGMIA